MALLRLLSKRLSGGLKAAAPAAPLQQSAISSAVPPNLKSAESADSRRFLHRRVVKPLPEFLSVPVGETLRERLKSINGDRIRFDGLAEAGDRSPFGVSVVDARKILRLTKIEKVKMRLKEIPESSILYDEFVQICVEESGNEEEGFEFSKVLDQCGSVIVLGNIVFLRPEQVAKSIENIISNSVIPPNDPRREELKELEQQKAVIDAKARAQVRGELYCGLGFLAVQTLGFMRLTFWELSWDVMEPICFFVTSFHFALAYIFFIKTSVEPSFEGYFQRRFKTKQKNLMKIHNFDVDKYTELRNIVYPNMDYNFPYKSISGV